MSTDVIAHQHVQLEEWRRARPAEDPEKVKRWGFVTAKPSEYLVHVRRGRVTRASGQGASCFKWPWDAVAVIPTSLQRLQFRADQITAEKVGVEIVGLAVYRIAEPLLAFRVLNFSYPERAQEKLEETLTAMFTGATRRIVATLGVEDCLTKRKSALAAELLREIAPVIGGLGRPDDATDRGWGVVLDTLEIQEVRVLSASVFAAMQAPYRARLDREAREAKAEAEQAIATREAERDRVTEVARIAVEEELASRRSQAARSDLERSAEVEARRIGLDTERDRRALETERDLERQRIAQAAELERERETVLDESARRAAVRRLQSLERESEEARASLASDEVLREAEGRRADRERLVRALARELRLADAAATKEEGLAEAEVALRKSEAQALDASAEAELVRARELPALATALGERMGEIRIHQYGSDAHPLAAVVHSLESLLDLARTRSGPR